MNEGFLAIFDDQVRLWALAACDQWGFPQPSEDFFAKLKERLPGGLLATIGFGFKNGIVIPSGCTFKIKGMDQSKGPYNWFSRDNSNRKPKRYVFPVCWLKMSTMIDPVIIEQVRRELDFFLVDKLEPEPWAYAIYHCGTAANIYSKVHWSYFPSGRQSERHSSVVAQLTAEDAAQPFDNLKQPRRQEDD